MSTIHITRGHLALILIIILAASLRLVRVIQGVGDQPMASFLAGYADMTANIQEGRGYIDHGSTPIQYYMPGYPIIAAMVGASNLLILQALADGIFGPALLFAALKGKPGLIAALCYALALPLVREIAWFLPDAMTGLFCICAICPILIWQTWRGAALSGFALGCAAWMRGDFLFLIPLLGVATWLTFRNIKMSGAILAASCLPVLALGMFWYSTYGYFSLTRPGAGLLAWEGLHQLEPLPSGPYQNQDQVAADLLSRNGLHYGTADGDTFLMQQFLHETISAPLWTALLALWRFARVITLEHVLPTAFAGVLALFATTGYLKQARNPIAGMFIALALWRVVPFLILRDEMRFITPLIIPYIVGVALLVGSFTPRPQAATATIEPSKSKQAGVQELRDTWD